MQHFYDNSSDSPDALLTAMHLAQHVVHLHLHFQFSRIILFI